MAKVTIEQVMEFFEQVKCERATRENFQAYLRNPDGFLEAAKSAFPSLILAADLIPSGWEVVEDVAPTLKSVSDLELVGFLNKGESRVDGDTMRQRANKLNANLGLADAKFLLDHQTEIPKSMRQNYIVFPGTVLRDSVGGLNVAYLSWDGGRWCLDFGWLVHDSDGARVRLAHCK